MSVDKETKYDRQLRLWASTGQSNLENSSICLINATATGCEILKNLILPGVGKFTIIDDSKVTNEQLSSNFFLKTSDLGKNVADCVLSNLAELNTEAVGFAIVQSVEQVLLSDKQGKFWDHFNCVIVSDYIPQLDKLIDLLWEKQIPLLIVNTIGFYGSLNLLANETTVIETHDPSKLYDLRIDKPWPKLQEYADSFDLEKLDDQEHAHVPYIVIFIKALNHWKSQHNNSLPATYGEKKQFKTYIESLSRNINLETNFVEAVQSCHRAFQKTQVPDSIKNLIELSNEKKYSKIDSSSSFWVYIAALKQYLAKNDNVLPLPGTLPDMASNTVNYTLLSKIYRDKARQDQLLFAKEVYKILESQGKPKDIVTEDAIASFCKNAQLLFVTIGSKNLYSLKLVEQFHNESNHSLAIYLGILTFNAYISHYQTPPTIENLDKFIQLFNKEINTIIKPIAESTKKVFTEMLTHNSRNYHNLSSFMGGVASQEILKLTTAQYIPLDNLFVFDGINSSSERFKI
ncbi:hypothetical protein KGF56_003918 [Candida oxycetoniae]|uniref:NEDD8-activating enzyme E1 regulatory subunit n=1 Tax=Candida oxycetoniae TaxID=497107 RepID=A0AAI9SVL7_9ASCO|nr:uncharacterized protein KGF56_003918 [Candida oxycetoniae]KAI3403330.2 hypothetical protein KGF56_003918 [Candida oxycetoniae]